MKKLKTYECLIGNKDETGIYAVSFVDDPAIESNFIALSKNEPVRLAIDKPKQVLTGAVLIPDKLIYRNDSFDPEGYYIRFSANEIEKIRDKMMLAGIALQSTTHQHLAPLAGNYLVEVWTVEDPKTDKSVALGLGEFPKGTLLASYKISSSDYWRKEVLSGKVRGFSIEGLFNFNNINMTKITKKAPSAKQKAGLFGNVPAFFRNVAAFMESTEQEADALVDEAAKDEVDAGTPYVIFPLDEGGEIWVDAEGNATLNGNEAVTAGEYPLSDGNVVIIGEDGKLVQTAEEATATDAEAPEVTMARQRGAQFFKKKAAPTANDKKIAELEKQIAELKKTPSAGKARPSQRTNAANVIEMDKNTPYHARAAAVIAERRTRAGI